MKFFQHSTEDVGIWIGRCHYEASHGRVALALERNRELASEFPDNPHIVYDEGIIRREYLGQGALARDLFKRAYDLATERNVESTRWFASCNAATLAPDEQEFREWVAIAMSLAPTEHSDKKFFAGCLSELDRGVPYKGLLLTWGQDQESSGNLGCSAAYLEIALLMGGMAAHNEAQLTRSRAEKLRGLDRVAETQRETLSEAFPPEERLALHEALAAIEKAIALDPYDAVLWNLKSAWCNALERYSESVESADRAIQLRPQRYPRPWINKALSLWPLGRDAEALACAQEALRQAEEMADEFPDDIERARNFVQCFSVPRETPCLEELLPVVSRILAVTKMLSDEALGQMNTRMNPLVRGLLKRFQSVGGGRSVSYVPMVAQLLSDFPVEVGFCIALEASKRNVDVHGKCVYAAQYLVVHSEGIQQRDSARFLALNLFLRAQGGADLIRSTYREAILETSAVTTGPLSQVDAIMRKELGRINPLFPQLIADQEPLSEAERERGEETVAFNFTGDPFEAENLQSVSRSMASRSTGSNPWILVGLCALGLVVSLILDLPQICPITAGVMTVLFAVGALMYASRQASPLLQCAGEDCDRWMQKLGTGQGHVMLTPEEVLRGVGTAEQCVECGRMYCDRCYPSRPPNTCVCGRGRHRVEYAGSVRYTGSMRLIKVRYVSRE